jgi:hypothetical protein
MSDKPALVDRPLAVTILCSLLATAGLLSIIYTFTGAFAPYGLLYPAAHTLIIVGVFASIAGIWSMEKWGTYLFLVLLALKFALDYFTGAFSFWELFLLIPAAVFIYYFRKMS